MSRALHLFETANKSYQVALRTARDIMKFCWNKRTIVRNVRGIFRKFHLTFPVRSHMISKTDTDFRVKSHPQSRYYAIRLAPGSEDVPYATDPYDPVEVECGLRRRLVPVMPMADDLEELRNFVQEFLREHCVPLPFIDVSMDHLNEWLEHNKSYNERRKQQLRDSFESIYGPSGTALNERDYVCKSFIKREFYEESKPVRWINSRSDRFKSSIAYHNYLIERQIYGLPWFVKGRDLHELPNELVRLSRFPYILETDYSSFESGFSPEYVDCVECELFRYMLRNNPEVLHNVMRCYYQVRNGVLVPRREKLIGSFFEASTVGTRMSGEMWTSLGNGFSNLMNIMYLCRRHKVDFDGFVEGDDGLFGLSSDVIQARDFESLGFRIKMNYGSDLTHTSFCGNVFDPMELKIIIGPEQIARLFWSCSAAYLHSSKSTQMKLLRAKALSLFCQGKYTPIAGKLALKVLSIIGKEGIILDPGNKWWETHILESVSNETFMPVDITMRSRILFAEKFGIPIYDQFWIESFVEKCQCLEDLSIPYKFMPTANIEGLRLV